MQILLQADRTAEAKAAEERMLWKDYDEGFFNGDMRRLWMHAESSSLACPLTGEIGARLNNNKAFADVTSPQLVVGGGTQPSFGKPTKVLYGEKVVWVVDVDLLNQRSVAILPILSLTTPQYRAH